MPGKSLLTAVYPRNAVIYTCVESSAGNATPFTQVSVILQCQNGCKMFVLVVASPDSQLRELDFYVVHSLQYGRALSLAPLLSGQLPVFGGVFGHPQRRSWGRCWRSPRISTTPPRSHRVRVDRQRRHRIRADGMRIEASDTIPFLRIRTIAAIRGPFLNASLQYMSLNGREHGEDFH